MLSPRFNFKPRCRMGPTKRRPRQARLAQSVERTALNRRQPLPAPTTGAKPASKTLAAATANAPAPHACLGSTPRRSTATLKSDKTPTVTTSPKPAPSAAKGSYPAPLATAPTPTPPSTPPKISGCQRRPGRRRRRT